MVSYHYFATGKKPGRQTETTKNVLFEGGLTMYAISRWDPFREMMSMRSTMDRLLENAFTNQQGWQQAGAWNLALDVVETEDEFLVKASIPGINPDDLEITFNNNTLTIRGETKEETEREDAEYHLRERRYGSFARSIGLPTSVDVDKVEATYDAGVLTLHLPKAEEVKPRRIAIHSGQGKVIEGQVSNVKKNNR
jgi:HSP20 family protein